MPAAILRRNRHSRAAPGWARAHLLAPILIAVAFLWSIAAVAAPQAGTVLTLRGDCTAATGPDRRTLALGGPIYVGDAVETAGEARLKLRMIDGTIISVASGSKLTVTDYASQQGGDNRNVELSLVSGLLRSVVSKVAGPARFEVDTAAGVAAVRGTDWFVRILEGGTTQVGVLTGRVELRSRATDRAVSIPAHWGAKLQAGKDPTPPRRWMDSEFADVIQRTNVE